MRRGAEQQGFVLTDRDACPSTRRSPYLVDVMIARDGEEPGAKVGAVFPLVDVRQSPDKAILNEFVSFDLAMG